MKSESSLSPGVLLAWLFLAYVAVLPASETIALRHLIMAIALVLVLLIGWQAFRRDGWMPLIGLPLAWLPLWLWWGYLCVFPLISSNSDVAWHSFRTDWLMSIGAGVIALVCASGRSSKDFGISSLAMACMSLVFVHWALLVLSWTGLLGPAVPLVMSWPQIWDAVTAQLNSGLGAWVGNGTFRWQFHGFDPDHGNLGLAATQSVALLLPLFMTGWHERKRAQIVWSLAALTLCLGSVLFAMSRGALIFCVLVILTGLALQFFRLKQRALSRLIALYALILSLVVGLLGLAIVKDGRWSIFDEKIRAALIVEDPVQFFCDGLTPALEQRIRSNFEGADADHLEALLSGMRGDGGRFLAARAGLYFVQDHPWGVDGSRHVFKHLMQEACGGPPAIEFAHTHNGWVDLLLALGWLGAGLYLSVFVSLMCWGLRRFRQNPDNPWSLALVLMLVFWMFRGLVDSVYREHALLMQAALILYLAGRARRLHP